MTEKSSTYQPAIEPHENRLQIVKTIGLLVFLAGLLIFTGSLFIGQYRISDAAIERATGKVSGETLEKLAPLHGQTFDSKTQMLSEIERHINAENNVQPYQLDEAKFWILKSSVIGPVRNHPFLFFMGSIILAAIGALIFFLPDMNTLPGIKHNNIFFNSTMGRGIIGILLGVYLIGFYILLYWYPYYIVNMVILLDPFSELFRNMQADRWFLYGSLYTVAVTVMGIRMYTKYRHNRYHLWRTTSIIFFQMGFAFMIPGILERFNRPGMDFKHAWPLDYTLFTDWKLDSLLNGGNLGIFMIIWAILLAVVIVPYMTYRYGKRWYCSWVCGCGGLAETLGDPFRQLSDKSLRAWKVERYMVHGVLVLAVVMTIMQVANYASGGAIFSDYTWRVNKAYSFFIGSAFAGVVGTGFYPLMGNRVWCRFGCPLAAIMGIIQKFKSRFVITTNGGQCISCGNCSTYCEMGIDVRWYAQRGQNIVRASCVGCGVCAAVCPRGVLRLENTTPGERYNVPLDDEVIAELNRPSKVA